MSSGSIIWKLVLSVMIFIWAVSNLVPWQSTEFKDYLVAQSTALIEEHEALLKEAQDKYDADKEKEKSFFLTLKNIVNERKIDFSKFYPEINISDIKNLEKRNNVLLSHLLKSSQSKVKLGLDLNGGVAFTFAINEKDLSTVDEQRADQLSQAKSIIARRVDGLGVAEPIVREKGNNKIEVQMPGISLKDNPNAAESLQAPALLELSLVHRSIQPPAEKPTGYVEMFEEREDPKTGEISEIRYYVKRIPELTGEIIKRAYAGPNEVGSYLIYLDFTNSGGNKFADLTRRIEEENKNGTVGQLAIILDGKLYSAPTVRKEISGGSATIEGRFSQREAIELANVLSNPLQVGLQMEEMYEIGPTLAKDSRAASLKAAIMGSILVAIFMIVYYFTSGFVAVISVVANVVIVIGTLSSLGATLTLPGVAALVLTIGMAVDANILIFERIREELKLGKNLKTALVNGYDKVITTIVDANITTLITASILIWLGTGPVKGFGVTLAIGIVSSMFSALIINRWILELFVHTGFAKKILGLDIFKFKDTPFLNYWKPAFITSWIIVFIGVVTVGIHKENILGIDFEGGDEISINFAEKLSTDKIMQVAREGEFGEIIVNYQSLIGQGEEILKIQTEEGKGNQFHKALAAAHPGAELELAGESIIGATVGKEVQKSALISVAVALLGILMYVAVRFEFGYGLGAVVATVHDILMTIGLYVFLGQVLGIGSGQFTAPMVASILMIVGYSINDTIVVFDRIREELTLDPRSTLSDIINLAINRTLSRTILTSMTTLLATFALRIYGAGVIVDFATVFIIGILTGTFSSIFIASPIFYRYHKGDRKKVEEGKILPSYDWEGTTNV